MGEERRIAHVDDAADFQRLKASMAALGIADSDRFVACRGLPACVCPILIVVNG
jgi:hypothetical protein